jgi:predicted aspartyl protease
MSPRVDVEVGGTRASVALSAILDTGFEGAVCVPVENAVDLGLMLVGRVMMEFADGRRRQELLFAGTAKLMGKRRNVVMSLTDGEEALVGTDLLSGYRVTLDFPEATAHFKRRPPKSSRG